MTEVFFDLETTGTDVKTDRIVQICIIVRQNGKVLQEYNRLINPEMPIPEKATEVHGITDEMVKDKSSFSSMKLEIQSLICSGDLVGYNIKRFDIPLLAYEFERAGISWNPYGNVNVYDSYIQDAKEDPRTLSAVYKKHTGKDMEGAHDALNDVKATMAIFDHQVNNSGLEEIRKNCDNGEINAFTEFRKDGDKTVFAFGKHKGKSLLDVDSGYINWFLKQDFPEASKEVIRQAWNM